MNPVEVNQDQPRQANGEPEAERLVKGLQEECERLRQALAKAEAERDLYLKAVYEHARSTLHFEDVDIASLTKDSAGPVLAIE